MVIGDRLRTLREEKKLVARRYGEENWLATLLHLAG